MYKKNTGERDVRGVMSMRWPRMAAMGQRMAPMGSHGFNGRLAPALTQLLAARPTRAALVLASITPLTPFPDVERELDGLDCEPPHFEDADPFAIRSLGEECKSFWRMSALKPIVVSAPSSLGAGEKLLFRRLQLHDICHVLLDFKADWPGQLGVFSFIAAQRYCPQFDWAARRLAQVYTTAAPWRRDELADAEAIGRRLALAAPRLLTLPIEAEWETPLAVLRDRLNIRKMRILRAIAEAPARSSRPHFAQDPLG